MGHMLSCRWIDKIWKYWKCSSPHGLRYLLYNGCHGKQLRIKFMNPKLEMKTVHFR